MLTNVIICDRKVEVKSENYFNLENITRQSILNVYFLPVYEAIILGINGYLIFSAKTSPAFARGSPKEDVLIYKTIIAMANTIAVFEIEKLIIHSLNLPFLNDAYTSKTAFGEFLQHAYDSNRLLIDYLTSEET